MAAPFLLAIHDELTIVGKSPDGDSIQFIPDTPEARADRKRFVFIDK